MVNIGNIQNFNLTNSELHKLKIGSFFLLLGASNLKNSCIILNDEVYDIRLAIVNCNNLA